MNTARLLAAAPLLLDRFYEMRTTIAAWVETGRISSLEIPGRDDFVQWLDDLSTVEGLARAADGRFPLEEV